MRETMLKWDSVPRKHGWRGATDNLRGFGNKLMMTPNFTTLAAKVKFKV
jgi:hypothetical protein